MLDRGGTFTDVWASVPGQKDIVLKLLSVDPDNYDDAPSEGIRRVLEIVSGQEISRRSPIPKDLIHSIRMGTTVATNGNVPIPKPSSQDAHLKNVSQQHCWREKVGAMPSLSARGSVI